MGFTQNAATHRSTQTQIHGTVAVLTWPLEFGTKRNTPAETETARNMNRPGFMQKFPTPNVMVPE
ncbi:MAG: hypothetical protein WBW41_16025 [Verrucomicrobiia bacterium]